MYRLILSDRNIIISHNLRKGRVQRVSILNIDTHEDSGVHLPCDDLFFSPRPSVQGIERFVTLVCLCWVVVCSLIRLEHAFLSGNLSGVFSPLHSVTGRYSQNLDPPCSSSVALQRRAQQPTVQNLLQISPHWRRGVGASHHLLKM